MCLRARFLSSDRRQYSRPGSNFASNYGEEGPRKVVDPTETFCVILRANNKHQVQENSTYPDAGYPDRLGPSGKFVENSKKLRCLEITVYWIKYSTLLWLLELQIRRGRKV